MTKIISIKELQTKTKHIREEIEKGEHFIVVWRSKPIFELRLIQNNIGFLKNQIPKENAPSENISPKPNGIWDYDISKMNLDDPEVIKWYLKRKIDFSDWESIDREILRKYLPDLNINPFMKKLLTQFLQHEKNSQHKAKKIPRRISKK